MKQSWWVQRILSTGRNRLSRQRDCRRFTRQYAKLFQARSEPTDPGQRVAMISLAEFPQQNKVEGILAKTLSVRGWTPIVVTYRSCRHAVQYFRAFGIKEFVFFDDLMDRVIKNQAAQEARRILRGPMDFQTLMELQYRGTDVGRHLLSTLTRNLCQGSVELSDPAVSSLLEKLLPRSLEAVLMAERLCDRIGPEMALLNEKGYTPYGEIFDQITGRGGDAIQWLGAQSRNSFALKRYTWETRNLHPFSLGQETWDRVRQISWPETLDQEIVDELKARYEDGSWFDRKYLSQGKRLKNSDELTQQLRLDPQKKTAVIFSHVLWDATFFYGENIFESYEKWLLETIRAASANKEINWVVKLHPDYVWKLKLMGKEGQVRDIQAIRSYFGELPEHIRLILPETDISTFSLFSLAHYCLTVRGTVGIEMACFGIPVFTAGTGRYTGLGFTNDSKTPEEYLGKIRKIHEFPSLSPAEQELARKHAYVLFKLRPWQFSSFELVYGPLENLDNPLTHDTLIHLHSYDDLVQAHDLNAFADWATEGTYPDYLEPFPDRGSQGLGTQEAALSASTVPQGSAP